MGVKLIWTLSGGVTSVTLFLTVALLNDRILPSMDILVVQVTDLCISQSSIGTIEQESYFVFTKSRQDQKDLNFVKSMSSYHSTLQEKNTLI